MYYNIKLRWKQPRENSDEMIKISKNFIVQGNSVLDAEVKFGKWTPSNYQDATVEEVKQTKIINIHTKGTAEAYWLAKIMDDADGRQRPQSYLVVVNGLNLEEVIKTLKTDYYMQEVEGIQKFKPIIDDDLITSKSAE
jgi:hypothetical protein